MDNREQDQLRQEVRAVFVALARPRLLALPAAVASRLKSRSRGSSLAVIDPAEIEDILAPEVERILAELAEGR